MNNATLLELFLELRILTKIISKGFSGRTDGTTGKATKLKINFQTAVSTLKHNLCIDIQVTIQEVARRVTKHYGDLSPHRKSNLVNQELKNQITDSQAKNRDKRALTPPSRKEADIEQDLKGILKSKGPRKESKFDVSNQFLTS